MARAKSEKAEDALAFYQQGLKLKEIAEKLGVSEGTVRSWKNRRGWDRSVANGKRNVAVALNITKRKRGGQPGNHNAVGGPPGNAKAEQYGFLRKYLPDETAEIFWAVEAADPLDLLWQQIKFQYTAIVRAQQIAYVKDQMDKTIEITMESHGADSEATAYEIEQAWEKQGKFLAAQARAMDSLRGLIKQYDAMLTARGLNHDEERELRLQKLRAEVEALHSVSGRREDEEVVIINDAPRDPNF